jgi:hypothetical protein
MKMVIHQKKLIIKTVFMMENIWNGRPTKKNDTTLISKRELWWENTDIITTTVRLLIWAM